MTEYEEQLLGPTVAVSPPGPLGELSSLGDVAVDTGVGEVPPTPALHAESSEIITRKQSSAR